ncbi:MAG: hypothetical protein H7Z19_13390 [Chitinophagaceae bacterium]|nr:hypothetical protein [Rubrivivax sp.]
MTHPRLRRRSLSALALIAAAAATVVACGGSDDDSAVVEPAAPAPPAAPSRAEQIAARTAYFGAENVNATTGDIRTDLVIMSWMTNTTFAAAINGKVVLLDAALMRRETAPGRTPTTLAEVVALMPSYIVIGKSTAGHADLAAHIAFRSGAAVIGAQEHCDAIEADARRQQNWTGSAKLLKCTAVVPKDQAVGQAVQTLALPDLNACLRAVMHSDASTTVADPVLAADSFDYGQGSDARDLALWPVGTAASDGISTTGAVTSPSVLYHFSLGAGRNFGLVWNDRAGSLREQAPAVATLLRSLPKTDVHVGSVDVGNAAANGLRDAALYVQSVEPKIFFPAGHDAASQRKSAYNVGELMKRALEFSMSNVGINRMPEVRLNFDPTDYVKPHYMTFDPAASGWQQQGDRLSATACG